MTNITEDYGNFNDLNFTNKCTDSENNIDIVIPTLILTIPCGLSFLCLMSWMVYTLNKPLFNTKCWRNFYTQIIHYVVYYLDRAHWAKVSF